jgi:2-dehydropantoate 2-reductase
MRISILGAGAIGCYFAGRLGQAKADVHVIARGATLDAIRRDGISIEGHVTAHVRPPASTIEEAPAADLLVSCVKAYTIPHLAPHMARLVKPGGLWVCMVNGIPWWYGDRPLDTVDRGGRIRDSFPIARTAGCVAYLRSQTLRPGAVEFTGGTGLIVGMPDGSIPQLLAEAAIHFTAAGIATRATDDIRSAVWNKLFGNVAVNPLSALTGCTVAQLLEDRELRKVLAEVIGETMKVARAEHCAVESDVVQRIQAMAPLGAFRSSMLQDVDTGRPLELDGILGAMIGVAGRCGIEVPASRRLYALVQAFAANRGLMPLALGPSR